MFFQMTRRANSDRHDWTAPERGFFHFLLSFFACAGGTMDPNG